MTIQQFKRILSGQGLPTNNSKFSAPTFRTILFETQQGISGDGDILRVDSSHELLELKEFDVIDVMNHHIVSKIEKLPNSNDYVINIIKSKKRAITGDIILRVNMRTKKIYNLGPCKLAGTSFITTENASILDYDSERDQLFTISADDYEHASPSPKDKLKLIRLIPISNNEVDTFIDINKIMGIEMSSASIGMFGN